MKKKHFIEAHTACEVVIINQLMINLEIIFVVARNVFEYFEFIFPGNNRFDVRHSVSNVETIYSREK